MRTYLQRVVRDPLRRLLADDAGIVDAGQYILIVTILGIGMIAGLATIRDQVVQEFGDIADSIESLDQSFSYTVTGQNNVVIKTVVFDENNPPAPVPGPAFPAAAQEGAGGTPPAGISFGVGASSEP